MSNQDLTYAKKFVNQLGNPQDFVEHVKKLESTNQMALLANFSGTQGGSRYLMVSKGSAPIIDFRHFFAAMSQRLHGTRINSPLFKGEGAVLMLGLGNELYQCVDEVAKTKLNSCFSREDLGSNRLGVEFAEVVTIKRSENSRLSTAELLRLFLAKLEPIPASSVSQMKIAGYTDTLGEIIGQVFTGVVRFIIPKAY